MIRSSINITARSWMFLSWLEKDGSESRFLDQYLRIYYKYRNAFHRLHTIKTDSRKMAFRYFTLITPSFLGISSSWRGTICPIPPFIPTPPSPQPPPFTPTPPPPFTPTPLHPPPPPPHPPHPPPPPSPPTLIPIPPPYPLGLHDKQRDLWCIRAWLGK